MSELNARPNIVLITMDTARAANFSCYDHDKQTTPFLEKLARENIIYRHAITQAPWTLPSHASIFSGDYISEHGRVSRSDDFKNLNSFTTFLMDKGYTTIGISNIAYLSEEFGFDQMFEEFEHVGGKSLFADSEIIEIAEKGEKEGRWDSTFEKYLDLLTSCIMKGKFRDLLEGLLYVSGKYLFLGDQGAKKSNELAKEKIEDREDPFFLFLNYMEPHAPYRAPFPNNLKFLEKPTDALRVRSASEGTKRKYASKEHKPDEQLMRIREALYNGELSYLDGKIGSLYQDIINQHPNTLFIITSDHGEYFGEHGLVNHFGDVHEAVSHVPLIVAHPEIKHEEVGETVELRKIADFVENIVKQQAVPEMDHGEYSFTEYYGANSSLWNLPEDFTQQDVNYLNAYKAAAYRADKKLIDYSTGHHCLFQLPEEEEISDSESEERLKDAIRSRLGEPEKKSFSDEDKNVGKQIKDKLRDLGYM